MSERDAVYLIALVGWILFVIYYLKFCFYKGYFDQKQKNKKVLEELKRSQNVGGDISKRTL